MYHIFCENKTKAQERLDKMYSAYASNPKAILRLIEETTSNCKNCFMCYLECKLDQKIERERICLNFTPDKIYDWNLLFDNRIFEEYVACKKYPSAYTEFKGIVYLIRSKIKNNDIWKMIDLSTVKLTEKEINALFGDMFEKNIAYVKALTILYPLFSEEESKTSIKILINMYLEDRSNSKELTEIRIEMLRSLGLIYNSEKYKPDSNEEFSKILLEDLLVNNRSDLVIKNIVMFENKNINPAVIIKHMYEFNEKPFIFLLESIESVELHEIIESTNVNGLLDFINRNDALKIFKTRDMYGKFVKFFQELALWIAKNIKNIDTVLIEKLERIDFSIFGDSVYYIILVNLLFNLKIKNLYIASSNSKAAIVDTIKDKSTEEAVIFNQSVVSEFIDDVALFKPYLENLNSFAFIVSKRICLNYSTAFKFIKTFGNKRCILENVIENLIFEGNGLENLLMLLKLSSPDLIKNIFNMLKGNSLDNETMNILRKYYSKCDVRDSVSDVLIISTDSEEIQSHTDKSMKTALKQQNLSVSNDSKEMQNHIDKSMKVALKQHPQTESSKKEGKRQPVISVRSEFVDMKRKSNGLKMEEENNHAKIELKKLKEIAAKINENNIEKEAVIIDNQNIPKFNDFLSKEQIDVKNTDKNAEVCIENKQTGGNNSLSALITQKSKQIMNTSVENIKKSFIDFDIESFYEECLLPFAPIEKYTIKEEIPSSFNSYSEYYDTFNPLKKIENIMSVRSSIFENQKYFECRVYSHQRILKIKVLRFKYEVHDMLYFSSEKVYFKYSDTHQMENSMKSGAFLGIVTGVYSGYFPNDPLYSDLVDIKVSSEIPIKNTDEHFFYKYSGNIISSLREFNALYLIKESSILKYLLRPSFLQDFLERKINWDVKKLAFSSAGTDLSYQMRVNQNRNELLLQDALLKKHNLNLSQAKAVSKSLFSREKFVLIQGPPGTGKTTTIMSIISTFLFLPQSLVSVENLFDVSKINQAISKMKILVCAPSNTAVDVITERLVKGIRNFRGDYEKINCLRVGMHCNPNIEQYTLEYLVENTNGASKSKIKQELLLNASVICTTLSSSVSDVLSIKNFDLIIIDEACQATEVSAIIPFKYNPIKVILVGDPKQLPPTVISDLGQLKKSLFERLSSHLSPVFLDTQYRMNPEICNLSSFFFYNNQIKTEAKIVKKYEKSPGIFVPLNFIDILKQSEAVDGFKSFYNLYECKLCIKICKAISAVYGRKLKIVILTPYKGQVIELKKNRIFEDNGIEVNTIDGFQGQECDITIFSTVRQSGLGFTCDFRRINVAMTRSKECVIVLGSRKCLSRNETWNNIINYFISNKRYTTSNQIDEFLKNLFTASPSYNRKTNNCDFGSNR